MTEQQAWGLAVIVVSYLSLVLMVWEWRNQEVTELLRGLRHQLRLLTRPARLWLFNALFDDLVYTAEEVDDVLYDTQEELESRIKDLERDQEDFASDSDLTALADKVEDLESTVRENADA